VAGLALVAPASGGAAVILGRVITKPLLIGAAAVLVTLLTGLGWTSWQLLSARESLGTAEQQIAQCREDLEHENRQVADLTGELEQLTETIAIERAAFESARLEAERQARARERQSEAERRARAALYADNPDCDVLTEVLVCQDIAERMIERRQALIQRWEGADDE
jgi:hypothetical protein